ncbi:hypothetical protein [Elizabethkingia anophelis]|uniref:Fibrobacter succinogenes major paralogous domain-containing protein n=1 Tax=Elizabethkingia anophelis TaxID=1117645 RepID=A0AAU8UVG8_9FLAO|nr:hypothetical protein [Elizabethkingia anophelis]AQX02246.1 hypothetical protein BBD32_12650 [Elizabethkingia anophelis]OPB63766.1 hypothetical protein BAY11_16820 [Elizabethkingia anophelis]
MREIHGAKYQWGTATPANGASNNRFLTQADDQSQNGTPSRGWSSTPLTAGWTSSGGPNNPCVGGFHVPTEAEWQAVINNNTMRRVGTWVNSVTNYGSGVYFSANGSERLFLPSVGSRRNDPTGPLGSLDRRGAIGRYWTSSFTRDIADPELFPVYLALTQSGYLLASNLHAGTLGAAVGCISN